MTPEEKWRENFDAEMALPRAGVVHLWRTNLDVSAAAEKFPGSLSIAEQERAQKFALPELRQRYVHARTWLRKILGSYLQIEPNAVPLTMDDRGKPHIDPGTNPIDLRFNLSHSCDFGLLAVTTGGEIGVDVQIEVAKNNWPAIAKKYFTANEQAHVQRQPMPTRNTICVEIWTRKEAVGKALGMGLHAKTFAFDVGPASWGIVSCGENLRVWSLAVEAPFAAAVAMQDFPNPQTKVQGRPVKNL